jgi:hypothetical protein
LVVGAREHVNDFEGESLPPAVDNIREEGLAALSREVFVNSSLWVGC